MRENRRDVTATFSSGGEAGMLERVSSGRGFRRDTNSHTMRGPVQRSAKSWTMSNVTHTAILAVRYFVTPLALYIALVAIGTYARYSNLLVELFVLCGLFVAVFFGLAWKSYIKAFMLICSVSLIAISIVRFGDDPVRRTLYKADALLRPDFDEKCIPSGRRSIKRRQAAVMQHV